MKKTTRFLAMILCVCLLTGIMAATASADEGEPIVVTRPIITLAAPEPGQTPAATAEVPEGAEYTVTKVEWTGSLSDGKFKADTVYGADVTVNIRSGANAKFDDHPGADVNYIWIDTVTRNSDTEMVVHMEFDKTAADTTTETDTTPEAATVNEVSLTVTAPETGKTPATTAKVPSDADYSVKKVEWKGSLSGGKFKADTSYTAMVTLEIKSGKNARFPEDEGAIAVSINGQPMDEFIWNSETEIVVYGVFDKTEAAQDTASKTPTILKEAKITVTAPVTGKTPATTAKVPSGANYTVKKVEWKGSLSGGKFKADTSYTVMVTLGIKSGKNAKFADDAFDAYVNDSLMDEIIWNSDTEIVVYGVFDKTAAAQTTGTAIDTILLTIDKPASGKTPATTAKLSAGSNGTVNSVVKDIKWSGELDTDGTFMPQIKYKVTVTMGIKSGVNYYFSDKSLNAKVNDKKADQVVWHAKDKVEVIYTFDAFGTGNTLTSSHITMDAPAAGEKPAATAHLAATASTHVSNIRWEGALDSNGCFQAGTEYTAYLTLKIKDEFKDKKFTSKTFTAYINGEKAGTVTRTSDKELLIKVEFEKTPGTPPATKVTFSDVPSNAYFALPVEWAVGKGITDGVGNNRFGPDQTCNQAQILTFLWRAAGSPKSQGTVQMEGFTGSEYYYQAAMWATENGMIGGEFNPDAPCTRAMAVGFMWKHAGSPSAAASSFTDVSAGADYANAVSWAVAKNVTTGTGNNQFSPDLTCTRGQIVTFLHRAFAN